MIFIFIIFILIILAGSKIKNNEDYLTLEQTNVIRGIYILIVFFSHFNSYVTYNNILDNSYLKIITYFGQAMVAPFLFYSGYGIMEQINKKDIKYIKSIPIKRILITIIRFDLAVFLFLILKVLYSEKIGIKQFLLSLIGWDTLGNSNWYIFTILILYLITYISFTIFKNKKHALISNLILSSIYISILYFFKIKPSFWFDTALCYILGMFYSNYKDIIYQKINSNRITYLLILIVSFLSFIFLKRHGHHVSLAIILNLVFSILVVIITMKLSIKSKILSWCGKHLFELYILQRIPMIVFKNTIVFDNVYIYFIVCMTVTIIIVIIFKKISDTLITKINLLLKNN